MEEVWLSSGLAGLAEAEVVGAASDGDIAPARRCENDFNSCSESWSLRKLEAMLMGLSALRWWWLWVVIDDDYGGRARGRGCWLTLLAADGGSTARKPYLHTYPSRESPANPTPPDEKETHDVTTPCSPSPVSK
jgi:hypothetical protein